MKYITNQSSPTQKTAILNNLRIVTPDTHPALGLSQIWRFRNSQLNKAEQARLSTKLAEAHSAIATLPLDDNSQVAAKSTEDMQLEYQLQENLYSISHKCSTFIIFCRLFSAHSADYRLLIDRGIIMAKITDAEVIAINSIYPNLTNCN